MYLCWNLLTVKCGNMLKKRQQKTNWNEKNMKQCEMLTSLYLSDTHMRTKMSVHVYAHIYILKHLNILPTNEECKE